MSADLHCFMSVAGPSNVVADYHARLMQARIFWSDKGWHWGFGICEPRGIAPIVNDPAVPVENRPPGESYMLMTGIWLGRDWDENVVRVTMRTISSLWPDLTVYFDAQPHYEGHYGVRSLWKDAECIVLDLVADADNPFYDDEGDSFMIDRRVHPTAKCPIPPFYQRDFKRADPLPTWEEIRSSIASPGKVDASDASMCRDSAKGASNAE